MRLKQNFHTINKVDVTTAIDLYIKQCQSRNLSPRTIEIYKFHLDWFEKYLQSHSFDSIEDVSAVTVREYIRSIQLPDRSPSTVHCSFRVVRSFLKFCIVDELVSGSVLNGVTAPRLPKKIMPVLTEQEIQVIIDHLSTWDTTSPAERTLDDLFALRNLALFLFMLDSGLRIAEAANIKLEHIDLTSGRVFVDQGKGAKDRVVFISEQSVKYIRKYIRYSGIADQPYLWIGQMGPLTKEGLQTIFRQISLKTKILVNPHKIRRTFATMMLRNGADLYRLKELMGHSDLRTLELYLRTTDADLMNLHVKCSPIRGIRLYNGLNSSLRS